MDSMYVKFRSQGWSELFSLLFWALEESLNRRSQTAKILFSLPPTPFRTFMMHNKDMVWANIGMNYLVINALGRSSWHHPAHGSSKFGRYCLWDLAYNENHSCPPHLLSKSLPGCSLPWSWYRLLEAMGISLRLSPAISLFNMLYTPPQKGNTCS